jgi:pilus assembly protein Flp/PilA
MAIAAREWSYPIFDVPGVRCLYSLIRASLRRPVLSGVSVMRILRGIQGRYGQGLAEYALILALIAIAAVLALLFLSGTITALLSKVGHTL